MSSQALALGHQRSKSYRVHEVRGGDVMLGHDRDHITLPARLFPIAPREGHRVTLRLIVPSPHSDKEWAKAYAKQGKSDLDVYALLSSLPDDGSAVASCHRLHYLQMAAEKIAKAFRFMNTGETLEALLTSHAASKEFLNAYFSQDRITRRYRGHDARHLSERKAMQRIARAIEELAPAVNREQVPQNVEYPWSDGAQLFIPCEHRFSFEELPPNQIQKFVKLLDEVVADVLAR
jgi:hypothetical protein